MTDASDLLLWEKELTARGILQSCLDVRDPAIQVGRSTATYTITTPVDAWKASLDRDKVNTHAL